MLDKLLGFIGLPSPAVLVGVLLALGAVAGWSYSMGDSSGFNRAEAARAKAQDGAFDVLRQELASTRAEAMAEARARAEATAEADRQKTNAAFTLKELRNEKSRPRPDCVPEPYRVRLNTAIDAVNKPLAGSRDTGILPISLPAAPAARIGFGPVDGGHSGGSGGVPAPALNMSTNTQ